MAPSPPTTPAQARPLAPWLTPRVFALLLGALIAAGFPQVLAGIETFVARDFGFFAYPVAYYQRECFWRGELPLWNPYSNCGLPFLAQWNTMVLYPPSLIYLLLPLTYGLGLFCLAHLFWAGLGMYFLARRWTGYPLAAAAAGVVFAFNGLSLNLLMWPSHIATLSWMPWVVLAVERAWQEGGRRLVVAALTGALQMLAGGPETILFTWVFVLAWCGVEMWRAAAGRKVPVPQAPGPAPARMLWRLIAVVVLVGGLAAAQLVPFLDLVAHSQRETGYADTRWSMPGWGWANFLVPMVFGTVWKKGAFYQYEQAWTSSYYLGVGALLLGCLTAFVVRDRRVRLLLAAAGVGLLLAVGDQFLMGAWLRRAVPQLSLITYPVKFVILVVFAGPLLVAFGMSCLERLRDGPAAQAQRRIIIIAAVLLALIGLILLWAWRWPFPTDDFPATLRNGLGRAALLVAIVAVIRVLCARPREIPASQSASSVPPAPGTMAGWLQRLAPLGLLLLLWTDVWTHAPPQNPTVPGGIYTPRLARERLAMSPQPELGQSRAMLTPAAERELFRFILSDLKDNFLVKRLGLFANCNLLEAVPKVNGFFSLYPRECGELNSVIYNGPADARFPDGLADFMGVSQVTKPGACFEWERRPAYLPPITAGQRAIFLDDTNTVRQIIAPDFDGRSQVYLPIELRGRVAATNSTSPKILSSHFKPDRVDCVVEASAPALVVIAQTWYHRWQGYVDDAQTPLLRANYGFQALEVPAGRHRVLLVYRDVGFTLGAVISVAALGLCAVLFCYGHKGTEARKT